MHHGNKEHLCGNPTLHHTDVVVRRSSFVHLHAAVGNHKHGTIREFDIGSTQGLELDQLCLADNSKSLASNTEVIICLFSVF